MNKYAIVLALAILATCGRCNEPTSFGFGYEEYKLMIRGFLIGITVEEGYLDHLLSCLTDQKNLEVRFVETMDKIDKLDFSNLPLTAALFSELYDIIIMSVVEIDLCSNENEAYDRLFRSIYNMMPSTIIRRLMLNFISNPQQIFKDIQDAIDNYMNKKYQQVGKDLGDIMHMILQYRCEPTMELQEYIKIVKGLLTGLNISHDIDNVLKCINTVPDVVAQLAQIIETLKNIDIYHIKELVEAMMKIFNDIKDMLEQLAVCAETVPELKEIVEKLSKLTLEKIVEKVNKDTFSIMLNLMSAKAAWEIKQYERFGKYMGNIIYKILLDFKLADN